MRGMHYVLNIIIRVCSVHVNKIQCAEDKSELNLYLRDLFLFNFTYVETNDKVCCFYS